MEWLKQLGPLLIAVGGLGGLAAILLVPAQIRKIRGEGRLSDADAASKLSAASIAMLQPAQNELKRLSDQLATVTARADSLTEALQNAQGELSQLRGTVTTMTKDLTEALAENERLRASSDTLK